MAERMVQVPVSLMREVRAALWFHVGDSDDLARRVAILLAPAALSQPTPSAEHEPDCFIHHRGVSEKVCTCHPVPRIEDMAPGTTFTEASDGWPRTAWTVGQRHDGTKYAKRQSDGWVLDPKYIDPSTIRDVTPPKEQS